MNRRTVFAFAVVDASMALALAGAYVLLSPGCAAMASCYLRDGVCLFVCVNPWTQVPSFLLFGLFIGVPPAVATAVLSYVYRRSATPSHHIVPPRIALPALLLSIPVAAVLFEPGGILFGFLALPIAAGLLLLANVIARAWPPKAIPS